MLTILQDAVRAGDIAAVDMCLAHWDPAVPLQLFDVLGISSINQPEIIRRVLTSPYCTLEYDTNNQDVINDLTILCKVISSDFYNTRDKLEITKLLIAHGYRPTYIDIAITFIRGRGILPPIMIQVVLTLIDLIVENFVYCRADHDYPAARAAMQAAIRSYEGQSILYIYKSIRGIPFWNFVKYCILYLALSLDYDDNIMQENMNVIKGLIDSYKIDIYVKVCDEHSMVDRVRRYWGDRYADELGRWYDENMASVKPCEEP